MTGPKEGKSDESSSGEDEESLRELVSSRASESLFFPDVVSVVKFSVGSRCNALEVFVIVFAVGFSCVPILL